MMHRRHRLIQRLAIQLDDNNNPQPTSRQHTPRAASPPPTVHESSPGHPFRIELATFQILAAREAFALPSQDPAQLSRSAIW